MTATANTVFRKFSADYTAEVHYAVSATGRVFMRTRARGWGNRYQNSAWLPVAEIPADAVNTGRKCRVPVAA